MYEYVGNYFQVKVFKGYFLSIDEFMKKEPKMKINSRSLARACHRSVFIKRTAREAVVIGWVGAHNWNAFMSRTEQPGDGTASFSEPSNPPKSSLGIGLTAK